MNNRLALGWAWGTVLAALSGSAMRASAVDAVKGPAGTLSYVGVVSGKVTFPTADCTFDGKGHLIVFDAPHQDDLHPEVVTPGPLLDIAFAAPGAVVNFTSDHLNPTEINTFLRTKSMQGISWAAKNGHWVVTLNEVTLFNQDLREQKSVTLSGSLMCTHLING